MKFKAWLHMLSFRGILPNWKLSKVLRIVGSGNGLNDRWMVTLLASLSGKLIPEEVPEGHKLCWERLEKSGTAPEKKTRKGLT